MSISTSWPDRNSRSAKLYERARAVLPGGISRLQTLVDPFPIYAGRGEGATPWYLGTANQHAGKSVQ